MGELHLEIVVDRLRREFGVKARVGNPQVAYRETVTRRAEGENKFVRVAAGPGGPAASTATSSSWSSRPTAAAGYVYENRAPPSDIPQEHAPAVEAGVTEAVERGVLAGHPMTDLRRPGRRRQLSPCRFEQLRVQGRRDPRRSSRRRPRPARPCSSR